jgi:hypothetical protein
VSDAFVSEPDLARYVVFSAHALNANAPKHFFLH